MSLAEDQHSVGDLILAVSTNRSAEQFGPRTARRNLDDFDTHVRQQTSKDVEPASPIPNERNGTTWRDHRGPSSGSGLLSGPHPVR